MSEPNLVPASAISDWGGCFRKRTGEFVYMRLSESSVKFLKLDPDYVYGVCYNGNVAKVKKDTLVVPMTKFDLIRNDLDTRAWERSIGVKGPLSGDETQESP